MGECTVYELCLNKAFYKRKHSNLVLEKKEGSCTACRISRRDGLPGSEPKIFGVLGRYMLVKPPLLPSLGPDTPAYTTNTDLDSEHCPSKCCHRCL